METRAKYMLVGSFTLLIIASALLFVIWTARNDKMSMRTYEITFYQGVSGLTIGSPVLLEGVRIGQVTSIKVSPTKPGTVLVRIATQADAPIRQNSEAVLEPQGITGVSAVAVSGGTEDVPLLADVTDRGIPRIPSRISRLQEIINSMPSILSHINDMVGPKNVENMERLIDSLSSISLVLAENRESLARGLRGFGRAGENFAASSRQLQRLLDSSQSLLDTDFREAARSVDQAATRFDKFVGSIEPGLTRFSRESADELHRLLVETRRLTNSLAAIARKLESDPKNFLFGNQVPEFSVP